MPATSETQAVHREFMVNAELIIGIIMAFVGIFMYFNGKDKIGSITTQLMSVVKNGSLDASGYLYIWGLVIGGIGILAALVAYLRR